MLNFSFSDDIVQYCQFIYGLSRERDDTLLKMSNDVFVEMTRQDSILWRTDSSSKYLCKMRFLNLLHLPIAEFTCSEITIFNILDSFEQFFSFGMDSISIPLDNISLNGSYDMLCLERINPTTPTESDLILFSLRSYSPITEQIITRISIPVNEEFFINHFMYLMYFSYLIDIDNGEAVDTNTIY